MPSSDFDVVVSEAHTALTNNYNPASVATPSAAPPAAPASGGGSVNLLDWDDAPAPAAPVAPAAAVSTRLVLKEGVSLPPARFQQLWAALPEAFNGRVCQLSGVPSSSAELEAALRAERIAVIASGVLPGNAGFKLFVCAVEVGDSLLGASDGPNYLVQFILSHSTREVQVIVKTDAPSGTTAARKFVETILHSLAAYGPR